MIEIAAYRPEWADEFARLAADLRRGLGPLALRIDHIGSTAVPGLPAKDVIDMQVTVARLEQAVDRAVTSVGYARRGEVRADHVPPGGPDDPEQWRKWFYREQAGRRVNLHVRLAGRANQRYPLLFRDYLRSHPLAADAYAQVKRALARLHPDDIDAYYEVKDPVCDIIMAGAEAWAAETNWGPGPSDG